MTGKCCGRIRNLHKRAEKKKGNLAKVSRTFEKFEPDTSQTQTALTFTI